MSNQKIILISLAIFVLTSFSYLAIIEKKQHQIKDGWFLYFENINDSSANFTIENYSAKNDFSWEIFADNNSLKKGDSQVLKGDKKSVTIDEPLEGQSLKIIVSHSKETKEIYKNF